MNERATQIKTKLLTKYEELQKIKISSESLKTKFLSTRDENLKSIDEEFERLINKLNERKFVLKTNYQKVCSEELDFIEKDIVKQITLIKNMEKSSSELQKLIDSLSNLLLPYFY